MSLREDLRKAVVEDGLPTVDLWTARHRLLPVTFASVDTAAGRLDPFFNTNRPDDLLEAEAFAGAEA